MTFYFNLIYTRKRVRGLVTTSPRQIQQIVDAPLIHVFLSLWVCGKGSVDPKLFSFLLWKGGEMTMIYSELHLQLEAVDNLNFARNLKRFLHHAEDVLFRHLVI